MEERKWRWTNYIIVYGSYEISLSSSMNCFYLCKFVASFPGIFSVSHTPDLLWKFREKGAAYVLVFKCFFIFFLFWAVHYNVQYLRKFTLSRIPSLEITCFLAHWLGNFSTISFYQISSFLSLNTFQDSCNNKIMSVHPNSFMLPKK